MDLEHTGHGFQGYANCLEGTLGIKLAYTERYSQQERDMLGLKPSPNEGTCHVDLPQSALDVLDAEKTVMLFAHIAAVDANVTRFDVYFDDYERVIEPQQLYAQLTSFEVCVPRFQSITQYRSAELTPSGATATGDTIYIGSRQSDKFIRVYDKLAESQGERDCVRWEAQYRRKIAHHAFMWAFQEMGEGDDFGAILHPLLKRLLCKDLDFRVNPDPASCDRPQHWATRWQVAPWWYRLMAGIEKAKFHIPRIKPTVEGIINWVEHQVLTSLSVVAAVKRFRGEHFFEWFYSRLAEADKRWSRRHNAIFDENARLASLLV